MTDKTGILQFHKAVYATSLEDLWLLVKIECDWFLYICDCGEEVVFVCLFYWLKHMIALGGKPKL